MPSPLIRYSTTPGSRLPQRVPIIRPSSAVNPMVEATLRRPCMAHRLAPLPRCATTTRPFAAAPRWPGSTLAMYSYDRP